MTDIKQATAVCNIFGNGQRVTAALLELEAEISACEVELDTFEVKGRRITDAYVSLENKVGERADHGRYAVLELDAEESAAATGYRIGEGRDSRLGVRTPVLEIFHRSSGKMTESTAVIDEVADKFYAFRYPIAGEEEKYLDYQFYIPEGLEKGKKYPLVLFMHDMGSCSDDLRAPLVQGNGAAVWAQKENQQKRPCFVVAPCYRRKTADDAYQVTWEAEATVALIRDLCRKCAIDEMRIYGTGQSMGCMMLCELNLRYPELFAGSFLVAGQWDPVRMGAASRQNFWCLVSERDEKAFPILGECVREMEKEGAAVIRGQIDAKAPLEEQNEKLRALRDEQVHIYFTWYEGDSVLPEGEEPFPGAFHVNTWVHAYSLDAVQEWLFDCRKLSGTNSGSSR